MKNIYEILSNISTSISFLPLILSLINYKFLKKDLYPIFILCIVSTLVEIAAPLLIIMQKEISTLSFAYTLTEFTLISLFYSIFLKRYFSILAKLINANILLFIVFSISLTYSFSVSRSDQYARATESFVFICYCLAFFYCIIKNLVFDDLLHSPAFWLNTGVLFYFLGNFTIFLFSNYIERHMSTSYLLLWKSIHTFFNVSMNILFSIGFWRLRTK